MNINADNNTAQDGLLSAADIAKILNISKAMAYRMMQAGKIRTVQIGKSRRVRQIDLYSFITDNLTPENS